jgi:hypothetical protein
MTRRWLAIGGLALAATAAVVGAAVGTSSCAQTPTSVAVRTLQQSQKIDVVCMHLIDPNGVVLPQPVVAPRSMCVPVAAGVTGAALPYHLFAVVTQTARGELAVVDLTAGLAVDEDRSTPGTNFIPVGTNPTDVAVGPDSRMTFVASAAPTKPAIYAIPSDRLLGDYSGGANKPPLRLTDLGVCSLERAPQALKMASRPDGGFVILALLREGQDCVSDPTKCATLPPKVVAIDPLPLTASVATEGIPDAGSEPAIAPLAPCPEVGEVSLSGALPASWMPGPTWPDGVPYADAGAGDPPFLDAGEAGVAFSVGPEQPPHPTSMALRDDAHMLFVADDAVPMIHVIDVTDPSAPKELQPLLATSLVDPSRRVSVGPLAVSPPTHEFKHYLYAADARDGSLMVFDVTDPANPTRTPMRRPHPELNPFVEPDRIVLGAPIAAVTFVENDWPIPSDLNPAVHYHSGILCNPNQNAHPAPGVFNDLGAYYRVDQAAQIEPNGTLASFPGRLRGVFGFATLTNGSIVAIDVDDWDAPCRRPDPMSAGPITDIADAGFDAAFGQTGRLALPQPPPGDGGDLDPYHTPLAYNSANYELAAVTLEPFFPVSAPHRLRSSAILLNDPSVGNHMPYQAVTPVQFDVSGALIPTTGPAAVTQPTILPTTLPHGWIDNSYLVNPTEPNPEARVYVSPDFTSSSNKLCGPPLTLLPGASTFGDKTPCTIPAAVRMSFDDPTADQDQDWAVVYEGALPSVSGIVADVSACQPPPAGGACASADLSCCKPASQPYETLLLKASGAAFCRRGIEDWDIGKARSKEVLGALQGAGLPAPPVTPLGTLPQWTSDYVQITDDILPQTDKYWGYSQGDGSGEACWQGLQGGLLATQSDPNVATNRYNFCAQTFGAPGSDPNQYLLRDMPILEAYDGALKVGRFGWVQVDAQNNQIVESTKNRVIVGDGDENSIPYFQAVDCCFHHQVGFRARAGGEWLTIGANGIGLLHHVQRDPADPNRRCVVWPDPRLALLNSRTFEIPWSTPDLGCTLSAGADGGVQQAPLGIPRESPLAMRNPMFSYVMWAGCDVTRVGPDGGALPVGSDHSTTPRDQLWKFSVRGGYQPIALSMSGGTNTFVSPQSMLFIDSLGQLAIVDGAQQGLVLIDLNSLGFVPGTPIY